ncbi:MAG: metalloprotease [Eubacteriales bacterium]
MPDIKIKFSTVVFAALFLFMDASEFAVSVLAAAAVHEAGHLTAMYICGIHPKSITVYPFGVDITAGHSLSSYRADIFVAAAGCAVNLLLTVIFFAVLPTFALCCAVLAVLNLLPIKSLDGGRIVECVLLMHKDEEQTARIVYTVSFISIVILWIFSVYILLFAFNPTLFFLCVYLFALIFLKKT